MYLLLYRSLKVKTGIIFERLPSLDVLSKMVFGGQLSGLGFLDRDHFGWRGYEHEQLRVLSDPKFFDFSRLGCLAAVLTWFALTKSGARKNLFSWQVLFLHWWR